MARFLSGIKQAYLKLRGFHTKRKLVVFESDDWGSIRMPSFEVYNELLQSGDCANKDPFLSNDCLESAEDLYALFEVLHSVCDFKGRYPVFTANYVMANPDFENIRPNEQVYEYELFTDTYKRYYPDEDVFSVVQWGIEQGVFYPQLHCREHLNVNYWMHCLETKTPDAMLAYKHKTIGVGASFTKQNPFAYMDAFNRNYTDSSTLAAIFQEANTLFNNTFGFQSKTFAPPCFVWDKELERAIVQTGVLAIQSSSWQEVPTKTGLKRRLHYTGEKSKSGLLYSVRNCIYEPAYKQDVKSARDFCIRQIEQSFRDGKPAIIDTHRLNYIGRINPQNSKNNLQGLKEILHIVTERNPDVEFVTTPQLIEIMLGREDE